jgi:hypothetical protein
MYAKIRDTRLPALGNVYSPASSTSSANWLTRALRPTRTVEEAERRRVRRGSGFGAGFMWTFKIASAPGTRTVRPALMPARLKRDKRRYTTNGVSPPAIRTNCAT